MFFCVLLLNNDFLIAIISTDRKDRHSHIPIFPDEYNKNFNLDS